MNDSKLVTVAAQRRGRPLHADRDRGSTRTVDRALALFDAVLDAEGRAGLTSLARAVDLSPSTASRLLDTLTQHRLIERADDGTYHAGIRLKQLAASSLRDDPLYELSGPHLDALALATQEVASLGTPLGGDEVLYLRQVAAPDQVVQAVSWVGKTIPRQDTALGMAISGSFGPHGYAVSHRPQNEVAAVAVPIFGHHDRIVGALSINAPKYRTSTDDLERFGKLLLGHGGQLSSALGASEAALATFAAAGTSNGN
jgi:DNA-binding IclR family transcriptional regulator